MKYILIILFFVCQFSAKSQGRIGADGKVHSTTVGGAFGNLNELDLLSDTTTYKHGIAVLNGLVYVYYGGKWNVSSGGVDSTVTNLTNYYNKTVSDGRYKPLSYAPTLNEIVANGYDVTQKIIVFRSYTGDGQASDIEYKHQFNDGTKSKLQVSLAPYDTSFGFANKQGDAVISLSKEGTNSRIQDIYFQNSTGGKILYNGNNIIVQNVLNDSLTAIRALIASVAGGSSAAKLDTSGNYINTIAINADALYGAATYVKTFHTGTITQNLNTQSAYQIFGTGSSAATPSSRYIDSNYFNGQWATQVRNASVLDSSKFVGTTRNNDIIRGTKFYTSTNEFDSSLQVNSYLPEFRMTNRDSASYWRMDRVAATNNGRFRNNVFQPGGKGNAIKYNNATNQYFTASDAGLPNGTSLQFTISFWYNNTITGVNVIWSYGVGATQLSIYTGSNTISIRNGSSGATTSVCSVASDGLWHNYIVTINGATVTGYTDGVSSSGSLTSYNVSLSGTVQNYITTGGTYYGIYQIDQLLIYNRVLSTTSGAGSTNEISSIYSGGGGTATPPTSGLIRRYDFESITSNTTPDTNGGTAYDLTLFNSPTLVGPGNGKVPVSGASSEGTGWEYSNGVYGNEKGSAYFGDTYSGTYMRGCTVKALINASLYPFTINTDGRILTNPANTTSTATATAGLQLGAGLATAGFAPFKFTSGTNLTTAEAGALEYDGSKFYATPTASNRRQLVLTNVATPTSGYIPVGNGTDYTLTTQAAAIAEPVTTYTDASQTVAATGFYILPVATANRNLALPSPASFTGNTITIWNKNTSGTFTWTFTTNAPVDATSTGLTTLTNTSFYTLKSTGSVWVKTN